MHTMPFYRNSLGSISHETAQWSGWEPSPTMSAPITSKDRGSPFACLAPAALGIKAHCAPDSTTHKQDLPFTLRSPFRRLP